MRRAPASLIVAAALSLTVVALAAAEGPILLGTVGPGFVITLTDAQGNRVTQLAAGPHELQIDDRSEEHNFRLTGPGINRATPVELTGKETWQVTLQDGTYTYLCDPHATSMRGTFQVGTQPPLAPPPSPPAPPPPAPAARPSAPVGARLALTVGPGFTISLRTMGGRRVTTLRPGGYTVVVRDRSASHNARVAGAGARAATSVPFVGSRTWKLQLRRGVLTFWCDPHRASMRGSVRIA